MKEAVIYIQVYFERGSEVGYQYLACKGQRGEEYSQLVCCLRLSGLISSTNWVTQLPFFFPSSDG